VMLGPRDVGRVTRTGAATAERAAPLGRYVSWTEGRLAFDDTPLELVVAELARWYDVDIRLRGGSDRLVTARVDDEPVEQALAMLAASVGLQLHGSGKHYTLAR
jgi:transmembrane sensor